MTRRVFDGVVVQCVRGDITDQPEIDAIVCAANAQLLPGGGVSGAIHDRAGPGLYEECEPLAPISVGEAVVTSGHNLPNRWCIHTLGPIYDRSEHPADELASCYRSILARSEEYTLVSVATPAISTGIFGYPVAEAAEVAIGTVASEAPALRTVRLIRFVLWDESDLAVHTKVLEGI